MFSPNKAGFTLLEIVATLIILGTLVLSVGAMVRNDTTKLQVGHDQFLAHLLHARAQGMASGGGVCLSLKGSTFDLTGAAPFPGNETLPEGVTVKTTGPLCFDMNGSVCDKNVMKSWKTTDVKVCESLSTKSEVALSQNGNTLTITLTPATGFAQ